MYNLKGFVRIKALTNNAYGVISTLGELSTYAMTFTKERGEYENSLYPELTFISFSSKRSDTGVTSVPPQYADQILNVINHAYNFSRNFSGVVTNGDILNHIINSFGNTIQSLEAGALVNSPLVKLPEWISWTAPGLGDNRIKIWLSDPAFVKQYDEYEIIVIPPVVNLDDLFRETARASIAIDEMTPTKVMESIQTLKNRHPETIIRAETFDFISPMNPNFKKSVTWHVIVYGGAGDNTDIIRNEIITHALNHSSFPSSNWRIVVPDLFRTTEFTILPDWLNYAIPNRTVQAGIYSPVVNMVESINNFKAKVSHVTVNHVDSYLQVFTHPYRSIALAIVGGEDNREGKFKFTDHYSDFVCVSSTSTDFSRMQRLTQEWSYKIQELIMIAENMSQYPDLPANVRKIIRNNNTYIASTINNVQFLVFAKSNLV